MAGFFAFVNVVFFSGLGPFVSTALAETDSFLDKQHGSGPSTSLDLESRFLSSISRILGSDHAADIERRVTPTEAMLRATLGALPRNEHGRYGYTVVRSALHRLFLRKHGWHFRGLDTSAETSPTSSLPATLPKYLRGPFEAQLDLHGLTAREVALLAAALENFVHRDSMKRFDQAFEVSGISTNMRVLPLKVADSLIVTYMAMGILGFDVELLKNRSVAPKEYLFRRISNRYAGWPQARSFASDVLKGHAGVRTAVTYDDLRDVVAHIADNYGRFQNQECSALKTRLLSIEQEHGSGHVTLAHFYNVSLQERAPFNETRAYLRQLGVLDESPSGAPRLRVSNYVYSLANCLSVSAHYFQCCINECDSVLEYLERELAAAEAEPERIVALIQSPASMYTTGSRIDHATMLQRLYSIADSNTRLVTLHSRSFALWLYHAFPRECPYPYMWNGAGPMDRFSYKTATGLEYEAGLEEMRAEVEESARRLAIYPSTDKTYNVAPLMRLEEEIYVDWLPPVASSGLSPSIRACAALSAACLLLVAVLVIWKLCALSVSATCGGPDFSAPGKLQFVIL